MTDQNERKEMDNSEVYVTAVAMESDEIPRCTSCNMRTGNFCDGQNCENNRKRMTPANALCNSCYELSRGLCPSCTQAGCGRFTCDDRTHVIILNGRLNCCGRCTFRNPRYTGRCCRIVKYCDKQCQELDWGRHKRLCPKRSHG